MKHYESWKDGERYHLYSSRIFFYNGDQPGTHCKGVRDSNDGQSRQEGHIHETGSPKEGL